LVKVFDYLLSYRFVCFLHKQVDLKLILSFCQTFQTLND
jgi:hypothetical protein